MADQRNVTFAITGAGGTRVARYVLESLVKDDLVDRVDLIVSATGRKIIAHETGLDSVGEAVEMVLGGPSPKVVNWDPEDLAGGPTSGSYPSWGMLVVPCALGVVGRIAHGTANTLIERAADVTLKERRTLVLLFRETPLHLGQIRLMAQATEAGAIVMPPVPAFYHRPRTIDDIVDQTVGRALDQLGFETAEVSRWSGRPPKL